MTTKRPDPPNMDDDGHDDPLIEGPDGRKWTWDQVGSWVIALSIRNALEMFHGGGAMDPDDPDSEEGFISDRQMKALNIVIRRTASKAVAMLNHPTDNDNLEALYWTLHYINGYMEPPGSDELERKFEDIEHGRFDPAGFIPDCTRSEPLDPVPEEPMECACGLQIVRRGPSWFHVDALRAGEASAARGCRAVLYVLDQEAWLRCRDKGKARPRTEKTRAHQGCAHALREPAGAR